MEESGVIFVLRVFVDLKQIIEQIMGITKPCTQLHQAPSTPNQLISTSIQLHPPLPNSFQPPTSSLQHPQRY